MCHFNSFTFLIVFFYSFLLKLCYKGDKSKRPTQCEEQSEQLSESEGEESERPIERKLTDDNMSLQAEVKKLGKIFKKKIENRRKVKSY